jgi:hypothetical protein
MLNALRGPALSKACLSESGRRHEDVSMALPVVTRSRDGVLGDENGHSGVTRLQHGLGQRRVVDETWFVLDV